ncbi:MAG: hypothetical protein ACI9YE_000282 [Psychroserpens sp.]|jgi:hypothetical protein
MKLSLLAISEYVLITGNACLKFNVLILNSREVLVNMTD